MFKKNIVSLILIMTFVISCATPLNVNASTMQNETFVDIYEANVRETAEIEGIPYTFEYFYDGENNRVIKVTNDYTGTIDIYRYDMTESAMYLNDIFIAKIESVPNAPVFSITRATNDNWIYVSSGSNYISNTEANVLARLSAILSAATGVLGIPAIMAAIGFDFANFLIDSANGVTVTWTIYRANTTAVSSYKCVWTLKTGNGKTYGPYSSGYTL